MVSGHLGVVRKRNSAPEASCPPKAAIAYSITSSALARSNGVTVMPSACGLHVDRQFKFAWVLDGKVCWLGAFQDPSGVIPRLAIDSIGVNSIAD